MDVKSAFLNGYLAEEVYVQQSSILLIQNVPRVWYDKLRNFLIVNRFNRGKNDITLFTKNNGQDMIIVQIYIDGIIFGSTNTALAEEFSKLMHSEFEMSMIGEMKFFLGLRIKQLEEETFISQAKYAKDLIKKFDMMDCKPSTTPMATSISLNSDPSGMPVDITRYQGMIGSLLYLTASRSNNMHAVCLCVRFQANRKESHNKAVK